MNLRRLLPYLLGLLILLLAAAGGAWWYLFAAPQLSAAQLVPSDTLFIATIPNAAKIATGYQTSHLRTLLETPEVKPGEDAAIDRIGQKNWDLLNALAPCLSGQSFIAITHFDPDQPAKLGFVAAMQPKPGLANFNDFITRLKAAYPELIQEAKTGAGNVEGTDYQWIQGPGAPDKICVAQTGGWIVTTWGEASLADWLQRFHHHPAGPSLAENADYKKSLARVGKDPLAIVYINGQASMHLLSHFMGKIDPSQGKYFETKLGTFGGVAVGSTFEDGEIVDRFSMLQSKQARIDAGLDLPPCPFETLKFTGPDTRLYLGAQTNWQQAWKNLQDQSAQHVNPGLQPMFDGLQAWAQGENVDVQHNIIDPLGGEYSVQSQWGAQTLYPELGVIFKLDHPDAFKPTITAIIDTVQKKYGVYGVINNVEAGTHHFATFRLASPIPVSPTIITDGNYFGVFLTENQAVESMERSGAPGLDKNVDFIRQIGDKRNGALQLVFVDTPKLLDRAYRTALPYASMAAMMSPKIAAFTQGRTLPNDLAWLAPMGTWSMVDSLDGDGITGYSTSGVGNQYIVGVAGLTAGLLTYQVDQTFNKINAQLNAAQAAPSTVAPPPPSAVPPPPVPPDESAPTNAAPMPDTSTNAPAASTPDTSTNAPAAPTPDASSSNAPAAAMPDMSASAPATPDTNAAPAAAAPSTNSDASPTNSTAPAGDMH